jgi:putative membrane protein
VRTAGVFALAGLFGMAIFDLNTSFIITSSPLFPALAGLFGMATLLCARGTEIPDQIVSDGPQRPRTTDVFSGVLAGGLAAVLPGVSAAIGATLVLAVRRVRSNETVVSLLSAINTATAFFVIVALFALSRARSGFALAIGDMVTVQSWDAMLPPALFTVFLSVIIVSAVISYYATCLTGRYVAQSIARISYGTLLKFSGSLVGILVLLFSGPVGLFVLAVGTAIGVTCLHLRVRRSACMGVLIVPLVVEYLL